MNAQCQRIEQVLDESEAPVLPADLAAHAQSCEMCRLRLAIARDLHGRLGAGAAPEDSRRSGLVRRIVEARPSASGRRRARCWPWLAAAAGLAAAAAIVAAFILRPEPRPSALPTELLEDMLAPLAEASPTGTETAGAEAGDPSALAGTLGFLLGDLDDPIALGRAALQSPQATAPERPAPQKPEER